MSEGMTTGLERRSGASRHPGFGTTIKRHKIDVWESYEVKKEELEVLERGNGNGLFLDFWIAAISISGSFFIAWLPVDYSKDSKLYVIYFLVFLVFFIVAIVFFCIWIRSRRNTKSIIKEIKQRPIVED